jgi:hypothetical protein
MKSTVKDLIVHKMCCLQSKTSEEPDDNEGKNYAHF